MMTKKEIRAIVKKNINDMPIEYRMRLDIELFERLKQWLFVNENSGIGVIAVYYPLADEPDLRPLWKELLDMKIKLAVPLVKGDTLFFHRIQNLDKDIDIKKIPEPKSHTKQVRPEEIAAVVVPGRAFDRLGGRVGRGGGHYDRWLAAYQKNTVSAAYHCQLFDKVPTESYDMRIGTIIAPDEYISNF